MEIDNQLLRTETTTSERYLDVFLDNLRKQHANGTLRTIRLTDSYPTQNQHGQYVVRFPAGPDVWGLLYRFTEEYPGFAAMDFVAMDSLEAAFNCHCTESQAQDLSTALIQEIMAIEKALGGNIKLRTIL